MDAQLLPGCHRTYLSLAGRRADLRQDRGQDISPPVPRDRYLSQQ